jgi:hypothetical protein
VYSATDHGIGVHDATSLARVGVARY